jgi:hypothetical protein
MATEILPTGDGIEETISKNWAPDKGEETITTKTGPVDTIEDLYDADLISASDNPNAGITNVTLRKSRGRGELSTTGIRVMTSSFTGFGSEEGLQELLAIDVLRPIWAAPYWGEQELDAPYIAQVRVWVENGNTEADPEWSKAAQETLFNHIITGIDTYYETAYVFRRTFRASSTTLKKYEIDDLNTVVQLPKLSKTLENFIDKIPEGEWLKRPTQFRFLGREGWEISEEYLWAPQWSIVYGGTLLAPVA